MINETSQLEMNPLESSGAGPLATWIVGLHVEKTMESVTKSPHGDPFCTAALFLVNQPLVKTNQPLVKDQSAPGKKQQQHKSAT